MRLAFTGKINTANILFVVGLLQKHFTVFNLPVCVDFDHVFDPANPTRCIARSNIDNPKENLFYVTDAAQAVLNQMDADLLVPGKYFSLLPCKTLAIEDSVNYANNLVVAAFIVSENDSTSDMANVVKGVYDALGVNYLTHICEDTAHCVDFTINGIRVCRVKTKKVGEYFVTVANVLSEPVFGYATSLIK